MSNIQCTGDEETLNDCTQTTLSLEEGKNKLKAVQVAGVTCYVPSVCNPPPPGSSDCVKGDLRLTGPNANNGEGTLEYCYNGLWSTFCSLNEKEALVVCRQLGYIEFDRKYNYYVFNNSYSSSSFQLYPYLLMAVLIPMHQILVYFRISLVVV